MTKKQVLSTLKHQLKLGHYKQKSLDGNFKKALESAIQELECTPPRYIQCDCGYILLDTEYMCPECNKSYM